MFVWDSKPVCNSWVVTGYVGPSPVALNAAACGASVLRRLEVALRNRNSFLHCPWSDTARKRPSMPPHHWRTTDEYLPGDRSRLLKHATNSATASDISVSGR